MKKFKLTLRIWNDVNNGSQNYLKYDEKINQYKITLKL